MTTSDKVGRQQQVFCETTSATTFNPDPSATHGFCSGMSVRTVLSPALRAVPC